MTAPPVRLGGTVPDLLATGCFTRHFPTGATLSRESWTQLHRWP